MSRHPSPGPCLANEDFKALPLRAKIMQLPIHNIIYLVTLMYSNRHQESRNALFLFRYFFCDFESNLSMHAPVSSAS